MIIFTGEINITLDEVEIEALQDQGMGDPKGVRDYARKKVETAFPNAEMDTGRIMLTNSSMVIVSWCARIEKEVE